MKTTAMKWVLMTMLTTGILFSCKKEESQSDAPACTINMTNLSGAYKLTALQYRSAANAAPVDYLAFMDDCEKDDILTLQKDGTWSNRDAGTVCTPAGTQQGTWQLSGSTLTSDGTLNGTIAGYDCKTLTYYTENTLTKGDRLTFILVKQ